MGTSARAIAVLVAACLMCVSTGCNAESGAESGPSPTAPVPAEPPSTVEVPIGGPRPSGIEISDAVPTLEELQAMGLGELAADCFIATIDPDGTGRVASAELFIEAFATCL